VRVLLPLLGSIVASLPVAVPVALASTDQASRSCAGIADDRTRLACYDALWRDTAAQSSDMSITPAPPNSAAEAPQAAAPAVDPMDDFGLSEAAKRARDPGKGEDANSSISGVVTTMRRQPAGELIVTLENGQVWTQISVDTRARVAVGDTVTIRRAALGSYMLVTANRYATRVRRVK
jgi:hypothetical protein